MQNLKKMPKLKDLYLLLLIISPIPFNLNRYTIPHFKDTEKFRGLTVGLISFAFFNKTF